MNEILVEKKILEISFTNNNLEIYDAVKENSVINIFLNSDKKKILITEFNNNNLENKEIKIKNFDFNKIINIGYKGNNINFYLYNNVIHYEINDAIKELEINLEYIINYLNKEFEQIYDFKILGINIVKNIIWFPCEIIEKNKKKLIILSSEIELINNEILIKKSLELKNLINVYRYIRNIGFDKNESQKLQIEKIDVDDNNNFYILFKIDEYGLIGKINYFDSINSYGSSIKILEFENNPIILKSDPISICILNNNKLVILCNQVSSDENKNGIIYYIFSDYKN